jgi:RHS repeat-associated protein
VWYIAPGTGSPTSGSAAAICEGQVQYGDSDPRYVFAASTNCSAPLPTGSNQTIVVSVSFSPTPVGIADGLSYSYNSGTTLSTLASIVNNAGNIECPQYWTTAVPPILAETCSKNCVGDPINPGIGNVYTTEEDIQIAKPSTIAFQRFYNSADAMGVDAVLGWRHSYDRYINAVYQTASADYPGQSALVSPQYSTPAAACTSGFPTIQASVAAWTGATASFNDGVCVLSQNTITIGTLVIQSQLAGQAPTSPIEYDLIRDDGQTLRYTLQNGIINNPPGTSIRLAITGSGFTVTDDDDNVEIYNTAGVLQSITSRSGVVQTISYDSSGRFHGVLDSFGNSITVTRNAQSDIQTLTLNGGGSVSYAYDGANRLTTVTNLDGTTRSYVYGNGNFVNALTSIIDESGTTLSTWAYNGQEQATSTQEALGADAQTLSYNSNGSVTVTDALGAVRTLTYTRIGDINKVNSISGSQCPTCQEWAATTYDSAGFVSSRTDYNGNVTCYSNDPVRGLELVRVEGFASGSSCPSNMASYTPTGIQRKISTTYSTTWREPMTITEATRTTSFTYDGSGNALTKTVTDTSVSPNVARTWTFTYNSYGQVLTAKSPRTDLNSTTTFQYYTCSSGSQCGQLQLLTNAVGQSTTYNTYNAYGQPLTITDPNGTVTTLTYDARQRVTSRQVGTDTTSYSYYPTGLLNIVTLPDSSTLTMTYDGAHRLTKIADGAGNYVSYTLDALGNRTAESAYDTTNTLSRTHSRVFNSLSQLYQDIGANSASTTTIGYDANGNPVSTAAPLSRNTGSQYDALNRLTQITDPASGVTVVSYDTSDNVASVIDPISLTTSYTHNGFNDLTQQVSHATGTTTYAFDSGGNLQTQTDARGAAATSAYDALNRVTSTAFTLGGVTDQTLSYSYDTGTNAKGRLTGVSDAAHSMAWSYDPLGRVTGMGQTVGGITKSIGYGYNNGDITTITTPSGQTVTYSYADHQITGITINSTTLLTNAAYEPFGPVRGWTWGNSTSEVRLYNTDGNPSQLSSVEASSLSYDAGYRITSVSNTTNNALSWTLGYDSLDRTTSASETGSSLGYSYDADGNRLTQTGASVPSALWTAGASVTYNARGRMSSAAQGGTTTYTYNALGQMIEKSGASTTMLVYDKSGHLVGEYTGTGSLIQETVWLNDLPVATLRPNGTGISIYYVHADQLGSPRLVTRPADNVIMWRWDTDPFGTAVPNQNPASQGTFVYNLRFPGQYYQAETGLNYNYFRDYDPGSGRYVESDPIGLKGGSYSTYSYVNSNPISNKDPLGLMCTPGVGCYTTPAEAAAAQSGNYLGYYQLACAGGDAYACFAQHIAANDSDWGHTATDWLLNKLHKKQGSCNDDETLKDIRTDLAKAYAAYLPSDPDNARWPDAGDIAELHWNVFGNYGLPPSTFGGTPLGQWGGLVLPGTWCPNCGGPRPFGAGMH